MDPLNELNPDPIGRPYFKSEGSVDKKAVGDAAIFRQRETDHTVSGEETLTRMSNLLGVGLMAGQVSEDEMKGYVKEGEDIAKDLFANGGANVEKSKDSACKLMWYLMARAASCKTDDADRGKEFVKGCFHLVDRNSKCVVDFLKECGSSGYMGEQGMLSKSDAYPRISSHFPARSKQQYGLDIMKREDGVLPCGMRTILFAELKDEGDCFIKLEDHPFALMTALKKPEHRHLATPKQARHSLQHAVEWGKKVANMETQNPSGYASRREDSRRDLKPIEEAFKKALRIQIADKEARKKVKSEGLKGGLYTMKEIAAAYSQESTGLLRASSTESFTPPKQRVRKVNKAFLEFQKEVNEFHNSQRDAREGRIRDLRRGGEVMMFANPRSNVLTGITL